jgi:hypothetical protein
MRRPLMSASAEPAPHHPESFAAGGDVAPAGPATDPAVDPDVDLDATQAMDRSDGEPAATADDSAPFGGDVDATPPQAPLLAGRLDANDVWRMVDQDPPSKMPTLSFDEVTGELPALGDSSSDGFRIGGEDLR